MVFTRSMKMEQEQVVENEELKRIRTEYDSSDEFVVKVEVKVEIKIKRPNKKKEKKTVTVEIPLTLKTGSTFETFRSTSDYIQSLKSPAVPEVTSVSNKNIPKTHTCYNSHLVEYMKTPFPVKKEAVQIDFDDAHYEWIANKKRKSDGNYVYVCGAPLKNGHICRRDSIDKIGLYSGCKLHPSWEEEEHKFPGSKLATF